MHQNFFEFRPVCKLLFVGNHKPQLRHVDEAVQRRLRLIPFKHRIPESERHPELEYKLRSEYPAILAWMIDGAKQVYADGIGAMPDIVHSASAEYFAESDSLGSWITENLVFDKNATSSSQLL